MSAHRVLGIDPETASKLDTFWESLSLEHRAALHTAFNLSNHNCSELKRADMILRNAESGRHSISSIRGEFLHFMIASMETGENAESMMNAILQWGQLTPEEQQSYLK